MAIMMLDQNITYIGCYFVFFAFICTLAVLKANKDILKIAFACLLPICAIIIIVTEKPIVIVFGVEAISLLSIFFMILNQRGHKHLSPSIFSYAILHIISGGLIIAAFAYLGDEVGGKFMLNLDDQNQHSLAIWMLCAGLMINASALVFGFWMIEAYILCAKEIICYLMCFGTKIALILLWKFFLPNEIFLYIGILTCLYAGFYSLITRDITKQLCYFAIMQIGIKLGIFGLSSGELLANYPLDLMQAFVPVLTLFIIHNCLDNKKTNAIAIIIAVVTLLPTPLSYIYHHQLHIINNIADSSLASKFFFFTNMVNALLIAAICSKSFSKKINFYQFDMVGILLALVMILTNVKYWAIDDFYYFYTDIFSIFSVILMIIATICMRHIRFAGGDLPDFNLVFGVGVKSFFILWRLVSSVTLWQTIRLIFIEKFKTKSYILEEFVQKNGLILIIFTILLFLAL